MKVLIIEDELIAQSKLETMLGEIDPEISVIARIGSVREAREYLRSNPEPDLAFVDIHLSDDHSFEIFRDSAAAFPLIFTTAYDKYLVESLEYNSIDYLLKPITTDKLRRSLMKFRTLEKHFTQDGLRHLISNKSERSRIVVRKGTEFRALNLSDIAYFFTVHKVVFARDNQGQQFMVDKNLTQLEEETRSSFFRINRKYLACHAAVDRYRPDNGKIRVFLKPDVEEEVHVSKETAPLFRKWIGASALSGSKGAS